ncbi:MAG: two-component system sensor histidine kinase NtrB [Methylocystaceae bacterium]
MNRIAKLATELANGWVIAAMVIIITVFHLTTRVDALGVHEFLRRLYYIPIILAAYRYRTNGGFLTALIAGLAYAPHLLMYVGKPEIQVINQLMEILLFIIVGTVTGALSEVEQQRSDELEYQLTQVKRLESEVRVADRLAAVGQLASGVAHEIRNPLGIIGAAAQLAKADDASKEDISESVTVILKEVGRANQVVSRLLDFARPHPPQFTLLDLIGLTGEAIRLTRQYAINNGVALSADLPTDDMLVEADAELIKQALVNLLMNAIQATPREGTITVKMGWQTHNYKPGMLMEITDTGIGISSEQVSRVFDPFYTTRELGTGLGLSIVHSIVKDHGGYIRIESEMNQGTSVYLWLPCKQEEVD